MRAPILAFNLALAGVTLGACNLVFGVTDGTPSVTGGSGGAGSTVTTSTAGTGTGGSAGTGGPCTSPGTATCDGSVLQICDGAGHVQSSPCGSIAACDAPNQRCNDAAPYGRLAVGGASVCVIDDSRNLQCWGSNDDGVVWTDPRGVLPIAEAVPVLTGVRQVSLGSVQIVLMDDGTVMGWGSDDYDELGVQTGSTSTPVQVPGITAAAVEVGAANRCVCARLVDGTVECWGAQGIGCMGDGVQPAGTPPQPVPTPVPDVKDAVQIAVGTAEQPGCAREASGQVVCWTQYFAPVAISGVNDAVDVSVGIYSVFLRSTSKGVLWSQVNNAGTGFTPPVSYGITAPITAMASLNSFVALTGTGQILSGVLQDDATPGLPAPISGQPAGTVAEIACGGGESYDAPVQCLRLASPSIVGAVYCWGDDGYSALGVDSPEDLGAATPVPGILGASSLETSQSATTVALGSGSALYWGAADAFADGVQPTPQAISFLSASTVLLRTMDTAYSAYAVETAGALTFVYQGQPMPGADLLSAPMGTTFLDAIPCGHFDIGLTGAGTVLVYASADMGTSTMSAANADGIFGNGETTAMANQLFTVPTITGATALAAYCDDYNPQPAHACALAAGAVSCWGSNYKGESGAVAVGSTPAAVTPITVTGETFVSVAAGQYFSCAAAASGKVYCWGYDADGELGNGPGLDSTTPVMVQGITTALGVTARVAHACAWLADGTAQCWGANDSRQLGNGMATAPSMPVTVQGASGPLENVTRVSAGSEHTCALLKGGSVACWGSCYYGQCGTGLTGNFTTPQRVQGLVSP